MLAFLFIAHAFACYAWMLFVKWETQENAAQIKADDAKDSLHGGFHFKRSVLRLVVALSLAVSANALLWRALDLWALAAGGLICLLSGYFVWRFNPNLNVARGKPVDYISREKNAALFDRALTWLGWKLLPALRGLFALGIAGYAAAMIIVAHHV